MSLGHACDRCREKIEEGRTLITVESGPLRTARQTIDLCAQCAADLAGFMTSPGKAFNLSA